MYLKVIIVDENNTVLDLVVVSQHGSDAEGSNKIRGLIENTYEVIDDDIYLEDEDE